MILTIKRIFPIALSIVVVVMAYFQIQSFPEKNSEVVIEEEIIKATVLHVITEDTITFDNREYVSQSLQIEVNSGSLKQKIVTVESTLTPKFKNTKYQKGDKLILGYMTSGVQNENFYIISYDRASYVYILGGIFILLSLIIAKKKGMYSLLGMGLSLLILTVFVLPEIIKGSNPLGTAILGICVMVPVLFYISHGISKKTTAAVLGTALTLVITAILAMIFVSLMHLTGVTFEEVETLLYVHEGNFDMQGVLLAGILLGLLGVIDDVAMTQASIVEELFTTQKKLSQLEIFQKAMNVGRDHIASVINTLILVYVGGSLTTLLLFTEFPRPLIVLLNSEAVLIPVVVALIGSIGLIIAIPITTILAIVLKKINQ